MSLIVPSVEVSSISGRRLEFPAYFIPRSVGNQTVLKKNSRGGVRVRVCSRIKDFEVGISELGHRNIGLYDVLAAAPVNLSTTSLPPKKSKEEEKQDYYVNMGYAIRTLREEFPELFYKELTFNIYRFEQIWIYMSSMYVHMCMHLYFCFLFFYFEGPRPAHTHRN